VFHSLSLDVQRSQHLAKGRFAVAVVSGHLVEKFSAEKSLVARLCEL
jgi:hypothetical protein